MTGLLCTKESPMKPPIMHVFTLCVVLLLLVACTMNSSAQSTTSSTNSVVRQTTPQMRPSDRMFYWYEEARELHSMATHREQEAELVLKKQPGPTTDEFVKQMRLFAHRLQEAAEYADAQAREAKREVSGDMIQHPSSVR